MRNDPERYTELERRTKEFSNPIAFRNTPLTNRNANYIKRRAYWLDSMKKKEKNAANKYYKFEESIRNLSQKNKIKARATFYPPLSEEEQLVYKRELENMKRRNATYTRKTNAYLRQHLNENHTKEP